MKGAYDMWTATEARIMTGHAIAKLDDYYFNQFRAEAEKIIAYAVEHGRYRTTFQVSICTDHAYADKQYEGLTRLKGVLTQQYGYKVEMDETFHCGVSNIYVHVSWKEGEDV